MSNVISCDICVIGGGSGGLSVAAGASQMGADVVLVEKGKMGGDCLNYGCVPSKALLGAGHAAQHVREAAKFGIDADLKGIDHKAVHDHVHDIIAGIEPHDSVERFEGLGVKVIQEAARFVGPQEIEVGDQRICAKRFVISTGSRARIPAVDGLDEVDYFTNANLFDMQEKPDHLLVLGGGPIGMEMAQAHRQLGCDVTLLDRSSIMPKDDAELVDIVRRNLVQEGVDIKENISVEKVRKEGDNIILTTDQGEVTGTHLLVAAGRQVNVDGLNLEAANVAYDDKGIRVDARLRTSNKKIFAIGDVAGGFQFTHKAGYDAGIVIRNALFRMPAKADYKALPWVTYTAPELATVGLDEEAARKAHGEIRIMRWPFSENDRARAERKTEGLIKVVTNKKGLILGASIVGPSAGELIQVWVLAISQKMKIGAMASMIAPYPTLSEVSKRAAGSFYTPSLFSEKTKKIVRFLLRFG
ncbi:Pyridine nucleotide-disulfide oxidoreductase dimerization region [Candidatus Terasakiella magnetica]|uniref:Pyridine nucleotide-disulfide oxidoreductase dimerization region n=1 Tax=Candidatus Terasakiella magnetica TaxID=1867952 RepID=A0A1C3RGY2_9PROT|nr:FAD-dependent oxidoreductase [Candidatus Terasakiella magnetica]SCA56454.1 Pyridine nucleotide-disulfide oxidoreductase dimerization region [Candidatus Terasakiella magnetica]